MSSHCVNTLRHCLDMTRHYLDIKTCLDTFIHYLHTSRHCLETLMIGLENCLERKKMLYIINIMVLNVLLLYVIRTCIYI